MTNQSKVDRAHQKEQHQIDGLRQKICARVRPVQVGHKATIVYEMITEFVAVVLQEFSQIILFLLWANAYA